MKTQNLFEASAPAPFRPSSVSKTVAEKMAKLGEFRVLTLRETLAYGMNRSALSASFMLVFCYHQFYGFLFNHGHWHGRCHLSRGEPPEIRRRGS